MPGVPSRFGGWCARLTCACGVVVAVVVAGLAPAGAAYPDPPPAFPPSPAPFFTERPLFSPAGGNLDRQMLVIYVHFNDVPEQTGRDGAWARRRFFGVGTGPTFPDVRGYFLDSSFQRLLLTPVSESEGFVDDGIVEVNGGDFADWISSSTTYEQRNRDALELADPYVDYSDYDTDDDGRIEDSELVAVNIRVARDGLFDGINGPPCANPALPSCGTGDPKVADRDVDVAEVANRAVAPGPLLDGVRFEPAGGVQFTGLDMAMLSTASNFSTTVHEIAHGVVHMPDLYAVGNMRRFDIAGATLGGPGYDETWEFGAWSKMRLGWITPTVITRDGYRAVERADTSDQAFVLYDPDRGTDDYLLVENRWRGTPGSYDVDASDSGLVVWRVDDSDFGTGSLALLAPPNGDAFDPSDGSTPQRDLLNATWRDGTPAKVKIRAIGDAGNAMRVYFDVPGPGVLVDTYELQQLGPLVVDTTKWNDLPLPVTNTGETAGVFDVTLQVPVGWQAQTTKVFLSAGKTAIVTVKVKPYLQAAIATYRLTAVAKSASDPAIGSDAPLDVAVTEHITLTRCESACQVFTFFVPPKPITIVLPVPVNRGPVPSPGPPTRTDF